MPNFQFEALNEAGKPQRGTIAANTQQDAVARIRGQGLFPTSVRPQKDRKGKSDGAASASAGSSAGGATKGKGLNKQINFGINLSFGRVKRKALTTFTRQFSTLQDAGLPILRSLQILTQQQKPGTLRTVLEAVTEDVSSGTTLSESMARHPKVFDRLYTKMIAAGEVAGVLDMILQRLSDFLEKAAKLRRKIIGAMVYPCVVIFVAFVIMAFIMVVVVPKFTKIFADFDAKLPMPTQILITVSQWLAGGLLPDANPVNPGMPGIIYLLGVPFLAFIGFKLVRRTQWGKAFLDAFALRIPVFGTLVAKTTIAKFTRTLGTLIRAGVPILDAILITRDTTANYCFQSALNKVHDSVRQGDSFAGPLRQAKVCDAIVVNMIDVGEETGDLDKMLMKIADNYDDEVDTAVAAMVSLLEPLMVVVLGLMVGSIVVSLFLPLVALIQKLGGAGGESSSGGGSGVWTRTLSPRHWPLPGPPEPRPRTPDVFLTDAP
jgi:type IV pilus assembly protein PilC